MRTFKNKLYKGTGLWIFRIQVSWLSSRTILGTVMIAALMLELSLVILWISFIPRSIVSAVKTNQEGTENQSASEEITD